MGVVRRTAFVEGTTGNLYEASGTRRSHRVFGASGNACPDFVYRAPVP